MLLLRQMPGAVHVVVVAHPVQILFARIAVVGEKNIVIIGAAKMRPAFLAEQHIVETDAVARRIHMQLADA